MALEPPAARHVELLLVGANNGQKQREQILEAASKGAVILVEPVPYLFAALSQSYDRIPNITCLNCCVTAQPGKVRFFAPTEDAIKVFPWGDQLGSMNRDHAVLHESRLAPHIVELEVDGVTFPDLIERLSIASLNVLFTDTEGYDATLLPQFPFDRLRPKQIIFEHKHADGTFNVGRKLGHLLIMLDELGYNMQIIDVENCVATRRTG